jgi:hypothetical protein
MVSRVRIEATGATEAAVQAKLLAAWTAIKEHTGGEWEIESEKTVPAKTGYWGYMTVRRKQDGEN